MIKNTNRGLYKRPHPLPHLIVVKQHHKISTFLDTNSPNRQVGKDLTDNNNICGIRFAKMK